jgi:hypothetical protein
MLDRCPVGASLLIATQGSGLLPIKTMEKRNEFLESDGLYWESETHEWFHDKISTRHAQKKSVLWGSGEQDDALKLMCFVVRNKETGEYDRVVMDIKTNEIIYSTKSLEDLAYYIDRLKVQKRFK